MSDFVKVASKNDITPGSSRGVTVGKEKVLLVNLGGKFYAESSVCTHVGAPLEKGELKDNIVTCPWHYSQFDVTTGEVVKGPAKNPLKKFEVKVEGDDILVRI